MRQTDGTRRVQPHKIKRSLIFEIYLKVRLSQTEDYYGILRIKRGATTREITASYRRLCKLYHGDINPDPEAEDLMKNINLAYHTLKDDGRRKEYDAAKFPRSHNRAGESVRQAEECVRNYFNALLENSYDTAFALLSAYDKRFVSAESFCQWRRSVQKLYTIQGFTVSGGERLSALPLEDGSKTEARLFNVVIAERNLTERTMSNHTVSKYAVREDGVWRIFLGYGDLGEITKTFNVISEKQSHAVKEDVWAKYNREMCVELDMLSLFGFLKRAEVEMYRHTRYRQNITLACFAVSKPHLEILDVCARTIEKTIRISDFAAYAGDGLFFILYTEMKKKYARGIVRRLESLLKEKAEAFSGKPVEVSSSFEIYSGGDLEQYTLRAGKAAKDELGAAK